MKITTVELLKLKTTHPSQGTLICCVMDTDEGIRGFGEFNMGYGVGAEATLGMAKELSQMIIGQNPMNTEAIWEYLYRACWWGLKGGAIFFSAMGGLDMAMWDIKGKALNTPVYNLLGGKVNNSLRAYASQIQYGWDTSNKRPLKQPEEFVEAALMAREQGFDCLKVDPIYYDEEGKPSPICFFEYLGKERMKMGYKRVEAIRNAVGDTMEIICEMHCLTSTDDAIQFANMIAPLNIMLVEEPVSPENPELLRLVRDKVPMPIAFGERLYTRWDYRPFFENRSMDMIQPDLSNSGGFSEVKKICDMAHIYDIRVQAHAAGGPLNTAASLHLEAAVPNFMIHETHIRSLLDYTRTLCKYDYLPVNGKYTAPDLPGIGQELSDQAIEEATIKIQVK